MHEPDFEIYVGFGLERQLDIEMQTKTDAELLSEYARHQSEAAFSEIVRRYADAIYSSALRQVGNDAQARDVAQTVFVDLARKAGSLGTNTLLIGWLHRGARLAALELLRQEQRRQHRERLAMEFQDPSNENDNWKAVQPVLDDAIANLGDEDRSALLLRFFQNQSLASVGSNLGVSEDAAQKRVSRALVRLRDFLEQRGIKTTAAALSTALAANAVQSAPANFAASLTAGVLANATLSASSTMPLLKLLTLSNMKTVILILSLAGGVAGITLVKVQSQHRLDEGQSVQQKQADEIESLRAANEQLARQTNELARWRDEARDVLKLRGEVAQLRQFESGRGQFTTTTETPPARVETNALDAPSQPNILIRTKFVTLPSDDLNALGSMGMPALKSGLITTLTDEQSKLLGEALDGASDVKILGKPQIITTSGNAGELSMTSEIPWNGTNARVGISLEVKPEISGPSLNLNLTTKLTWLVDMSQNQDGSQTILEDLKIPASISVLTNQTVVLVKEMPKARVLELGTTNHVDDPNVPKTLLVFVTASVDDQIRYTSRLQAIIRKADPTNGDATIPSSQNP